MLRLKRDLSANQDGFPKQSTNRFVLIIDALSPPHLQAFHLSWAQTT